MCAKRTAFFLISLYYCFTVSAETTNDLTAVFSVLNKITTRLINISLAVGEEKFVGDLSIQLEECSYNKTQYKVIPKAKIKVIEHNIDKDPVVIFYGYIVKSLPSKGTVPHGIYEIFLHQYI